MKSSTEIEAKFDAGPEWQLPELGGVVVRDEPSTELVAVYWDTEDRRLDKWGVTLRRRLADDGAQSEWAVKLPLHASRDDERQRREVTVAGDSARPPAELLGLLTAMSRGRALEPVAELRTDRRRWRAGEDLWSDVVEITDDRVTSTVAGRAGPAFRQVEVELLDEHGRDAMASITAALHAAGLEPSADDSKLRRVLGTSASRKRTEPPGTPSLRQLASAAIERSWSEVVRADPWIRLDDDAEVVHTCRKAVRRLRLDLKALRPVLKRRRSEALRDELKWYGGLLGEVRDLHVLRQQVLELSDAAGVASADRNVVVGVLESQIAAQRRNLLSALDGDRYVSLISALSEFHRRVPFRSGVDPDEPARDVVARAGRTSWKKVDTARRRAVKRPSPARLHELRKKVKHVRATSQLAATAGSRTKKFTEAAGTLKEQLGDLHDADVLVDWLDDLPERLESGAAYSAGRLRELTARRRVELERAWPAAWKQLDRKRLRRWTR